jgi:hypothetical protein
LGVGVGVAVEPGVPVGLPEQPETITARTMHVSNTVDKPFIPIIPIIPPDNPALLPISKNERSHLSPFCLNRLIIGRDFSHGPS